jgi:hypothetical protein
MRLRDCRASIAQIFATISSAASLSRFMPVAPSGTPLANPCRSEDARLDREAIAGPNCDVSSHRAARDCD